MTLGELCAIQGQVEHLMVDTLSYALDVRTETARKMLASSSLHTNAIIWIAIFREKCRDQKTIKLAESAFALVQGITQGRNDFVHAVFATATGTSWMLLQYGKGKRQPRPTGNAAVALRTRDMKKKRPISDLKTVRNNAAELSVLLSDIAWAYLPNDDD